MARYEYEFHRIKLSRFRFAAEYEETEREYKEVIHQHAQEGWRLVQIFAPSIRTHGQAAYYELIFEREPK